MIPDAHLLIVDDDERIRSLLQKFLMRNGFLVTAARDAAHARRILLGLDFDLIILDVMMPGEDGVSLTKHLRETRNTPILLLTARGETADRILGLEAGADDYLAKPFEPKELLLRINAILRRAPMPEENLKIPKVMYLGEVRYDVDRGELLQGETRIRLTATESHLMRIFSSTPGVPLSRTSLVAQLVGGGNCHAGLAAFARAEELGRCARARVRRPPGDQVRECRVREAGQVCPHEAGRPRCR